MTREELRAWLDTNAMSQSDLARAVCVREALVALWLSGGSPVPGWLVVALRGVKRGKA